MEARSIVCLVIAGQSRVTHAWYVIMCNWPISRDGSTIVILYSTILYYTDTYHACVTRDWPAITRRVVLRASGGYEGTIMHKIDLSREKSGFLGRHFQVKKHTLQQSRCIYVYVNATYLVVSCQFQLPPAVAARPVVTGILFFPNAMFLEKRYFLNIFRILVRYYKDGTFHQSRVFSTFI